MVIARVPQGPNLQVRKQELKKRGDLAEVPWGLGPSSTPASQTLMGTSLWNGRGKPTIWIVGCVAELSLQLPSPLWRLS